MATPLNDVLVPVRFLTTTGQLIGTLAVFIDSEPHILAVLPTPHSPEQYGLASEDCMAVLVLSIIGLLLELISLIVGLSVFDSRANALHCWLHGMGCVGALVIGFGAASYAWLWYIFWVCGALPFLVEATSWLGLFWLRTAAY
mmetsp:Transcript_18205/g.37216  ORF Transcript_18205/g.37216 Transcript_18205/m.37216 type:complete len:143 (-) Transcript_18205:299-727(-)